MQFVILAIKLLAIKCLLLFYYLCLLSRQNVHLYKTRGNFFLQIKGRGGPGEGGGSLDNVRVQLLQL